MKKHFYPFLALVFSIFLLTACTQNDASSSENPEGTKQNQGVQNNTSSEENQVKTAEGESTSDNSAQDELTQTNQKLNYYVDCVNTHSNKVLDSYSRYLSWVDEKSGPTGNERNVLGLYPLYVDIKACLDGLKKAQTAQPVLAELDKAGAEYSVALEKIAPLLTEANSYYEEKNYKDDKMAKGKEMHPKLMEAWKAFDSADQQVRAELEKIQSGLDEKQLAELEKTDGRKYAFLTRNSMYNAKKIMADVKSADITKINLENLTKGLETYEKAYNELKDYHEAHKGEDVFLSSSIDTFLRNSKDFLTSSKELMRRIRDKVPYDSGEQMLLEAGKSDWMVDGSPGQVLAKYNSLVDSSNSLSL